MSFLDSAKFPIACVEINDEICDADGRVLIDHGYLLAHERETLQSVVDACNEAQHLKHENARLAAEVTRLKALCGDIIDCIDTYFDAPEVADQFRQAIDRDQS